MSNNQMDGQSFPTYSGTQAAPPAGFSSGEPQQYGVLKCFFFTPKRGDIWGAFSFLFNGTSGVPMENVFWVTRSLTSSPLDINLGWRELNKLIPQMGIYEKAMGDKLVSSLLEVFSFAERMELSRDGGSPEFLDDLGRKIRDTFERTTHYFLDLTLVFEPLAQNSLVEAGVLTDEITGVRAAEAAKPVWEQKSFAGTLITCLPVIDPVHGKPISELEPGDKVEVKLQGGIGAGELINQFLASAQQDAIFPIFAIEKKEDDRTYILLDINDELKGLVTVSKDLRLRVLAPPAPKRSTISINMDNVILLGTFSVAIAIIVFLIRYIFPYL